MPHAKKPMTDAQAAAHERMLAGIVNKAATNGRGLAVAVPGGSVGGKFDERQEQPPEETDDQQQERQAHEQRMQALATRIHAAIGEENVDDAVAALLGLVVTYATAPTRTPEFANQTLVRLVLTVEAIGADATREIDPPRRPS